MEKACIIVPSHINNINRTKLLVDCLQSLVNQTVEIPIYLSISFETELDKTLFNKMFEKNNLLYNHLLCVIYQEKKNSQFRHIEKVVNKIKNIYEYVLFCDDDDTYDFQRVEKFMCMIQCGIDNCSEDKKFVGCYESDFIKISHSNKLHEYWSYCVNIYFIINFINIIKKNNYDYYIDNVMCDMLFSSYLRRLDDRHMFVIIHEKLYNYNRNEFSITKKISKNNENHKKIIKKNEHNFEIFIEGLNTFLETNIETIKTNIFLDYSCNQITFENVLTRLLKEDYKYKDNINKKILEEINFEYNNIKCLCDVLYQN